MVCRTCMILLSLVACSFLAATASAHPKLIKSDPASGATAPSPKELRLSFNEILAVKFCGADVEDEKGHKVEVGPAALDPADKKQLIVPLLKPLVAGIYTVEWHAVAADTHRVTGTYSFTVGQ